jgi:TonB family protein
VYSGQLITRITIKQSLLRVDGERIIYVAQKGAMQLSAMRTGLNRYIEIDLPSNLSLAAAAQALANIFAGTEGLGPYVPDFWKRYMLRQSGQSTEISECDRQATGGGSTPNTPAAPITTGSTPSTVIASQLIKQIRPRYAEEAKQFRIQGVVFLDAIISETGDISEVHVARPVGGSLEETAIEAVRQWKYSPTLQDGRPVWVWTCLTVNYEFR